MSLKISLIFGLCLVVAALSSGERARYDNYRVYKVNASSKQELAALKDLEGSTDSMIFLDGVHAVNKDVNVVVAPHKVPDFLELMGTNEIEYELVEKNLQSALESDDSQIAPRSANYGWTAYYTLEDTYTWMKRLAMQYPGTVTLIEGGKSYQSRSILGVKISAKNGKKNKPGIFLEAGIHAREWIAPATATYFINQLLTSDSEDVRDLGDNYDWYIFPHTNPDGYVYTHTTDRLWRKTRTPYGRCFGADPNRNWDFHWNEVDASSDVCLQTYAGPFPFSELESRSLANYISTLKGKIQLYISFHSYSQVLLFPYGYTSKLPKNYKDLKQVSDATTAALNKRYGTKYIGDNISKIMYPASGSSVDWVYAIAGIKMSFSFELRPRKYDMHHFILPAEQIVPTGEETLDGVVAMVNEVKSLGYFDN